MQSKPNEYDVTAKDGRRFSIIPGRRWTKVPEYMSNGQRTARFFIDETTGRVHAAESWKRPKSWPLPASAQAYVLEMVGR